MKKVLCLSLALLILLAACSGSKTASALTWQEQYDLGVRYLSEGNYEEAIIAFTAAIEIDPKRPEAYIGRGDAHAAKAAAAESGQAARDVYLLALEDYERAIALGADGLDEKQMLIRAALEQLELSEQNSLNVPEMVTANGYFMFNYEAYLDQVERYVEQCGGYGENGMSFLTVLDCGVRFQEPLTASVFDESGQARRVEIQEAQLEGNFEYSGINQDGHRGDLVGKLAEFKGYFTLNKQTEELKGPVYDERRQENIWIYRPNGPYVFHVESYHLLNGE